MAANSPDFDKRVREIVAEVLTDPLSLPREFKGWLPRYLEMTEPALHLENMVGNLNANRIKAKSITADKLETIIALTSALVAGTLGGTRVEVGYGTIDDELDTSFIGIRAFDGDGQTTFILDAVTGDVYLAGQLGDTNMEGSVLTWGTGSKLTELDVIQINQQDVGFATPTIVQQADNNAVTVRIFPTASYQISAEWPNITTAGNHLFMVVTGRRPSGITNWTNPNGWTQLRAVTHSNGNTRTEAYYIPNASSRSGSEGIRFSEGVENATIQLFEVSGLTGDLDGSDDDEGSSTTPSSGTTGTLAQAESWAIAFVSHADTTAQTAPTNGYTAALDTLCDEGSPINTYTYTNTLSATTATSTSNTVSPSAAWVGAIGTFRIKSLAAETPSSGALSFYAKEAGGYPLPHVLDDDGTENAVVLGTTGEVWRMELRTVSVDIANTSAQTGGTKDVTISGLIAGDRVVILGRASSTGRNFFTYAQSPVTVADTVTIQYYNADPSPSDPASVDYDFLIFHRS